MRAALTAIAVTLLLAVNLRGQDVTFSTPYEEDDRIYYNDRAVGVGKEAFQVVVDRIGKLPAGTSVVWGPNYNRCGACGRQGNPFKDAYLDLWNELERHVASKKLLLSSAYPGPWQRISPDSTSRTLPEIIPADRVAVNADYAGNLEWRLGTKRRHEPVFDERFPFQARPQEIYVAGKSVDHFELDRMLAKLPERASLLVRITLENGFDDSEVQNRPLAISADLNEYWDEWLADRVSLGKFKVTLTAPQQLAKELSAVPPPLVIDWSNYHGPDTPPGGVLYFLRGQYVGHGNSGLDRILAALRQHPLAGEFEMPQYRFSGRYIADRFMAEELEVLNAKVSKLVPFPSRRAEFEAIVRARKLSPKWTMMGRLREEDPASVIDWDSGDRYGAAFASFGRIIRYDAPRKKPAALLGWSRHERGRPESEAKYTLNDVETGIGDVGFEAALNQLATLPAGSLVQVRVCIRTKPPFICPLVYQDQRHFERTGYEPYVGMFPWLIDTAKKHRLQIEWLPDEGKSLQDCELNK